MKTMVKTLKRGDPATCNKTMTEEKICKRKPIGKNSTLTPNAFRYYINISSADLFQNQLLKNSFRNPIRVANSLHNVGSDLDPGCLTIRG